MTPTSVERGQETRARLIAAAGQLIVEEGWGAVTTRKLAARADVRPGLVHYHFGTVTDLLVEASLATVEREVGIVMGMLAQAPAGPQGVEMAVTGMAQYSADPASTVLTSEMLLAATRNERLRTGLATLQGTWLQAVAQWLGEHGLTADPEPTALVLGALLDGLVLHRLVDPELAVPIDGPLRRLVGLPEATNRPATP
ncbi:TetR/AcrR family transcriptional regulator [Catenulispora sp. NF23]|uniref:TetR/AcrR family transcriptional regulator n=1 Tax=Catenulispora pinistramenti TaxID=2705254 RepID=A0ABS5KR64_9ACTN|nr:TetR family transcriptional regulator [Catenulispora pinistramenti]MBS2534574.1 TetR/AcrR family transcriptional regulator [Catenulispora pinistramenti]MBS2548532.1 TetR/AcrR family transcriptional regulator [Catenulispora pinistramenti]